VIGSEGTATAMQRQHQSQVDMGSARFKLLTVLGELVWPDDRPVRSTGSASALDEPGNELVPQWTMTGIPLAWQIL